MLNLITMIEYVNSFLLLTLLGTIYHIYYKYKIFFRAINVVKDFAILDQLNNLQLVGKNVDSEVIKTKRGRKKKTDTKTLPTMNEEDTNDIKRQERRFTW